MRPTNSAYDRDSAQCIGRARKLLNQYQSGETISHEELDKLDDMGFREVIAPNTIEQPDGYKVKQLT